MFKIIIQSVLLDSFFIKYKLLLLILKSEIREEIFKSSIFKNMKTAFIFTYFFGVFLLITDKLSVILRMMAIW